MCLTIHLEVWNLRLVYRFLLIVLVTELSLFLLLFFDNSEIPSHKLALQPSSVGKYETILLIFPKLQKSIFPLHISGYEIISTSKSKAQLFAKQTQIFTLLSISQYLSPTIPVIEKLIMFKLSTKRIPNLISRTTGQFPSANRQQIHGNLHLLRVTEISGKTFALVSHKTFHSQPSNCFLSFALVVLIQKLFL